MNIKNKAYIDLPEEQKEKARKRALRQYYKDPQAAAQKAKLYREKNKDRILQQQKENKRARKLWAIEYLGECCHSCGKTFHPSVYEFHHKDPSTKDRDPSKMMSLSHEKLQKELDKCVLLCANCHRIEHHGDSY